MLLLLCLPETSMDLSWKVLLTEAKTQFGVQNCKVRVYKITKIAINIQSKMLIEKYMLI